MTSNLRAIKTGSYNHVNFYLTWGETNNRIKMCGCNCGPKRHWRAVEDNWTTCWITFQKHSVTFRPFLAAVWDCRWYAQRYCLRWTLWLTVHAERVMFEEEKKDREGSGRWSLIEVHKMMVDGVETWKANDLEQVSIIGDMMHQATVGGICVSIMPPSVQI